MLKWRYGNSCYIYYDGIWWINIMTFWTTAIFRFIKNQAISFILASMCSVRAPWHISFCYQLLWQPSCWLLPMVLWVENTRGREGFLERDNWLYLQAIISRPKAGVYIPVTLKFMDIQNHKCNILLTQTHAGYPTKWPMLPIAFSFRLL